MNPKNLKILKAMNFQSLKTQCSPQKIKQLEALKQIIKAKAVDYDVKKILYEGKSSYVFELELLKSKQTDHNKSLIIKTMAKKSNKTQEDKKFLEKKLKKIRNEISLHKLLQSQYVINLLDYYETQDYFLLKLQKAEQGSLSNYLIQNKTNLSLNLIQKILLSIAKCIQYLHSHRIVHRDLKPQNILLDEDLNAKITDFGLALKLDENQKISGLRGTLNYIAPQIKTKYDQKVDVWAFGCIIYYLLMFRNMFEIKNKEEIFDKFNEQHIKDQIINIQKKFNRQNNIRQLKDLLQRAFKIDPQKRISMKQIVLHPFFRSYNHNNHQQQSQSSSQASSEQFQPICNTEPQPTLTRKKSFRKIQCLMQSSKSGQFKKQQNKYFYSSNQNDLNLLNTRLSKFLNNHNSQKSSNTSLCSLRSQRYQKIAARRQNLSRQMQKSQAFLIQQNRPLIKKRVISPIKIGKIKDVQINTLDGKIKITKTGLVKQASFCRNSLKKNCQFYVSLDGKRISVTKGKNKSNYELESLPQEYYDLYQFCKDNVKIHMNSTVKMRFQVPESYEICLMLSEKIIISIKDRKYNTVQQVPQQISFKNEIRGCEQFLKKCAQ